MERRARSDAWFNGLVRDVEPGLRHALVAVYGQEQGRDATAEALAYAWEHRERVKSMANPAGYLYRVGRSRGRTRHLPRPYRHICATWFSGQTAHIAGYGRGFLVAKRPWVNEQKGRDTATVQGGYGTGSHSAG